jgi:hypoxanthine phosphoribosyltransferase
MSGRFSLREIYSAEQVSERIEQLADELAGDFSGASPVFVAIAEGARYFTERMVEALAKRGIRPEVQVVRARRTRGTKLRPVRVEPVDGSRLCARDVLVLDDIADEGRTLEALLPRVRSAKPRSLRVAVLVNKRVRRRVGLSLDYVGFEIPDGWVVGAGMDLDGKYRELGSLSILEPVDEEA